MLSAMPSPWCVWSKRAGSNYDMNFNAHQACLAILCVHSDMGVQIRRLLFKPCEMLWNAVKCKQRLCLYVTSVFLATWNFSYCCSSWPLETSRWILVLTNEGKRVPRVGDTKCVVGDFCLVAPETWHCWSFHAPPLIAPDHFCLQISRG